MKTGLETLLRTWPTCPKAAVAQRQHKAKVTMVIFIGIPSRGNAPAERRYLAQEARIAREGRRLQKWERQSPYQTTAATIQVRRPPEQVRSKDLHIFGKRG